MLSSLLNDDTWEEEYLSYYFDDEAQKILPRFNLTLVKLENLTEWLREENDNRRSPLSILETLVISDYKRETTKIFDRSRPHKLHRRVS